MAVDPAVALRLVEQWLVVWRLGNVSAIDDVVSDPYIRHTAAGTELTSRADYKKLLVTSRS